MNTINTLPSNWAWSKIDEITFVNPKNDYSNVKSNLPVTFVPMAAVDDVSGSIMTPEVMSFEEARKGHTKFLENDVIFARITPCMENGKIAIARNLKNGFGFGSTEFHVIRAKDGILPDYIYHYVRQEKFRNFAAGFMTSTVGQLRVSKDVIENAEIPLAPTKEQKRIISKIEELFKESKSAREVLDKIPTIVKKLRQSILASAFRGELVSQDPNDEPAEKLLEKIKQERRRKWEEELKAKGKDPKKFKYEEPQSIETDELPDLPKDWVWTSVGELYDIIGGGTPSTKVEKYWEGNIPWISSADIYGLYDIRPRRKITHEAIKNSATNLVPSGSIIVVTRVGLGKIAFTKTPICFSQDSQALVGNNSLIDPNYALYYLSKTVQIFKHTHRGTTIAGVTKKQLSELPFPLPPIDEQQRISSKIAELYSFADQIEKSVEEAKKRADKIDQAILAKAFLGELVPQDPNDESASVLLERIKKSKEVEVKKISKRKIRI
ncbi:restriction endonuclease subunit S [Candidatus Nitrosotenuis cloacae]|uniref:restriction endonuclease subunit S n=1 Tax=Candidatus Nitrosotenuis cloacae TaxID=1603555 RepID=UPI000AF73E1C|nr:restriction endonuclease subunit S [Candidatus Nitrosotenuis cloacae]